MRHCFDFKGCAAHPKWTIVQGDPDWLTGDYRAGKWIVYPPHAGWDRHAVVCNTHEEAIAFVSTQA